MKMPDALLFEIETTVHVDANDGGKTTLDIKLSEGRNIVFCKNCRHCRIDNHYLVENGKRTGEIEKRYHCILYMTEIFEDAILPTSPDGFCHHGEEKEE